MTDVKKVLSEYKARRNESHAKRREFIVRLGSAGLGVAAGTMIAGCGGGGNGTNLFGGPANGQGNGVGVTSAEIATAFQDIQLDENDHVTFLVNAITNAGGTPRPRPTFSAAKLTAPDVGTFVTDSAALENTGTGAYPYVLTNPNFSSALGIAQAAATIALVEGRHAGFLNALKGRVLLTDPNQADAVGPPRADLSREIVQPPSQVAARAAAFLGTVTTGAPAAGFDTALNGGAGFPPDTIATDASINLFTILNYALLLEYLERDFYNINVPKYFGGNGPVYSPTGP